MVGVSNEKHLKCKLMENPRAFGIFFSGLFLQQAVLNLNIYLLFIYTLDIVLKCLQSVKKFI